MSSSPNAKSSRLVTANTNLKYKNLNLKCSLLAAGVCLLALGLSLATAADQQQQPISSRAAFLRAQRASRLQQATATSTNQTGTTASHATSPSSTTVRSKEQEPQKQQQQQPAAVANQTQAQSQTNRTARTADLFQNGDGFNIFVTNTCERELMHVNIKTSRPFFGVIHTRNQRQKAVCSIEGTGEIDYNLDISHVLNQQDPNYCGVIKARRESPDDKDLLSVVIAVRVRKDIELSDDKFFLLNCTNRCRRPDCSGASARLTNAANGDTNLNLNDLPEGEREAVTPSPRPGSNAETTDRNKPGSDGGNEECTIYKFPWVITLLWCLSILLLAMVISHCIMCSSMVCKCIKTEVEEREPSVYEDETDDEDNLYNKKNHPMRIDYDNRDIYKTSNNYEPYDLNSGDKDCDKRRVKSRSRR